MLLKVGSRFGVGPVRSDNGSSHPTIPRSVTSSTASPSLLTGIRLHLRCWCFASHDDELAPHLLMAITAVLGAENRELSRLACRELDDNRLGPPRNLLLDVELLDLQTVHAVGRDDAQAHLLPH